MKIDLHIHSSNSDSLDSKQLLQEKAIKSGQKIIAENITN